MKEWFWTFGWKLVLALIVAAVAMWFLVHLERVSSGEASVAPGTGPALALLVSPGAARPPSG